MGEGGELASPVPKLQVDLYNFSTLRAIVSFRQINWQLTDSRTIIALDLILRRSFLPRWRIFTDWVVRSEWDLGLGTVGGLGTSCMGTYIVGKIGTIYVPIHEVPTKGFCGDYRGRDEIHWACFLHLIDQHLFISEWISEWTPFLQFFLWMVLTVIFLWPRRQAGKSKQKRVAWLIQLELFTFPSWADDIVATL